MPLVTIWVLKGQFDADQKAELITRVTDGIVATAGESSRALTWVLIEEIDRGGWGAGGRVRSLDHARAARPWRSGVTAETVLVIGSTGHIGGPVAQRLMANGFGVRLFVRDVLRAFSRFGDAFDYAVGDVNDRLSLDRALEGCTAVHVSLGGGSDAEEIDRIEHQGTALVAERAASHGLQRLTYLSGDHVGTPEGERLPSERAKARAEAAVRQCGVPYTIFRPTYFMDTLPRHIQGRLAVVLGRQPHRLHMVAATDFGDLVSASLRTPDAANRVLTVRGPEPISIPDALRTYCSIVAPHKRVVTVPLPLMSAIRPHPGRHPGLQIGLVRPGEG